MVFLHIGKMCVYNQEQYSIKISIHSGKSRFYQNTMRHAAHIIKRKATLEHLLARQMHFKRCNDINKFTTMVTNMRTMLYVMNVGYMYCK